jgi:hypothetical protein
MRNDLSPDVWVITEDAAKNRPFTLRRWTLFGEVLFPTTDVFHTATLDEARTQVPKGLTRIPRFDSHDIGVREMWL